ncbi:hypothetical protein HF526_27765, partial [Pseudonocardia sp. K10HN5]|nr:hypothetical protein [Pseudonocardia acidicola]
MLWAVRAAALLAIVLATAATEGGREAAITQVGAASPATTDPAQAFIGPVLAPAPPPAAAAPAAAAPAAAAAPVVLPAVAPQPAAAAPAAPPAAVDGTGIPGAALAAYRSAEQRLAGSTPPCRVSWTLLAGVGRVESGHASGGRVDASGNTRGPILGPRLDGAPGVAAIADTDGGALDGDTVWDRAVGPMQFIPSTWRAYAVDGNGDGVASPHNIFDASLTAGRYLCAGGADLSTPAGQRAALLRYNRSDAYASLVLRWAQAYGSGVAVLPSAPGAVPATPPTPPEQVPAPAPVQAPAPPAPVPAAAAAPVPA